MAYDYSTGEPGPIAPLAWVEQAVEGTKKAVADDSKLVLGVPMYGYNWVVATAGTCPPIAEGRTGVTARSVDDLIARRGGHRPRRGVGRVDVHVRARGHRRGDDVHTDPGGPLRRRRRRTRRIDLARDAGLGGVALWALGYETDGTWATIDDAIRASTAGTSTVAGTTAD